MRGDCIIMLFLYTTSNHVTTKCLRKLQTNLDSFHGRVATEAVCPCSDARNPGRFVFLRHASSVGGSREKGKTITDQRYNLRMRDAAAGRRQHTAFGKVLSGDHVDHPLRSRS